MTTKKDTKTATKKKTTKTKTQTKTAPAKKRRTRNATKTPKVKKEEIIKKEEQIQLTETDVNRWIRWQTEVQLAQLKYEAVQKQVIEIFNKNPGLQKLFTEYENLKGSFTAKRYKYQTVVKELATKYKIDFTKVAINDETGIVTFLKDETETDNQAKKE
jgi:hypothetical protein